MEAFNLAQLTKEMVVTHLRSLEDPVLAAAEVVRSTILARLKGRALPSPEAAEAVLEIVKGGAAALVVLELPLARGAAALLRAAASASKHAGVDPELAEDAAIRGIADLGRFATPERLQEIGERLNQVRLGAREVFERHCGHPQPYQSHPGYVPPRY